MEYEIDIPTEVEAIIEHYATVWSNGDMDYSDTEEFLGKVKEHGYTFDYDLDNVPYDFRKI